MYDKVLFPLSVTLFRTFISFSSAAVQVCSFILWFIYGHVYRHHRLGWTGVLDCRSIMPRAHWSYTDPYSGTTDATTTLQLWRRTLFANC